MFSVDALYNLNFDFATVLRSIDLLSFRPDASSI